MLRRPFLVRTRRTTLRQLLRLFLQRLKQRIVVPLLLKQLTPVHISLKDRLESGRVVSDDFLLDVEDGDVLGDVDFSEGHGAEEGRFSDTVATDETDAAAVGEGEGRVGKDTVGAEVDLRGKKI
jgi:hypothetical protein